MVWKKNKLSKTHTHTHMFVESQSNNSETSFKTWISCGGLIILTPHHIFWTPPASNELCQHKNDRERFQFRVFWSTIFKRIPRAILLNIVCFSAYGSTPWQKIKCFVWAWKCYMIDRFQGSKHHSVLLQSLFCLDCFAEYSGMVICPTYILIPYDHGAGILTPDEVNSSTICWFIIRLPFYTIISQLFHHLRDL